MTEPVTSFANPTPARVAADPAAPAPGVDAADALPQVGESRSMTLAEALEMGQRLQRGKHYEEAEQIYLQVLQASPGHPEALNCYGVLRFQQGQPEEALELLAHAVQAAPEIPGTWVNFANVLIERGHHEDAVKALQQAVTLAPDWVLPRNNLGVLHMRLEQDEAAEASLLEAVRIDDDAAYVHYNLARLYFRMRRLNESGAHSLRTTHLDPNDTRGRSLLARSKIMLGDLEGALQQLRDWVEMKPDDPEARHYLAAAGGAAMPTRASDAYVSTMFDRFAASFDSQLERLGYRAPPLVAERLARHRGDLPPGDLLDAGCGTGLCAPLLRPMAARLEGVDLSEGMLARARTRGGYDALHQAELTAFLERRADAWDAIASADVLMYFGDMAPVFQAVRRALRPGGLLVATTECLDDETKDYELAVHGRYSHSARHLREAIAAAGLELVSLDSDALRREMMQDVRGWVFVVRKPLADA